MPNLTEEQLQSYYSRIHSNDREILNSDTCSCIFCRQTYSARDISDWISNPDGTLNAICPICGMDTVIGDRKQGRIDHDDLKEINLRFFGEDFMEKHPEALKKYVRRYRTGQISKKQVNENLFKHYLTIMADNGDHDAIFALASLYFYGTEWTKKDPQMALALYTKPCMKTDGFALTQVGQLLQSGYLKTVDHQKAMEYYAKGMALEIGLASLKFADCYFYGLGVDVDYDMAFAIYSYLFGDYLRDWVNTKGKISATFGDICYRLGFCYDYGCGIEPDARTALRYYLVAAYAYSVCDNPDDHDFHDIGRNAELVQRKIGDIAKDNELVKGEPCGDIETLLDSVDWALCERILPAQRCILHIESYDEDTKRLELTVHSKDKQFIVDCEDLYAGFISGPTRWVICGNIIDNVENNAEFNHVEIENGELRFSRKTKDKEIVVLRVETTDYPNDEEDQEINEGNVA